MSGFWALDYLILAVVLASAVLVVRLRNLNGAVMALSATGTMLALLFIVLGAPDVAHSEVVVGAIALPVLYLAAIGKTRAAVPDQPELSEEGTTGQDPKHEDPGQGPGHEDPEPTVQEGGAGDHGR